MAAPYALGARKDHDALVVAHEGVRPVDASTIVAICATAIAVASLAVSVYEARASRRHNRLSVRPLLELRASFRRGQTAGLQLVNAGLGPAVITRTVLRLDGAPLGPFDEATVNRVREGLATVWPAAVTFDTGSILATDYERFLLGIDAYNRDDHAELAILIRCRLGVELHYQSIYGGQTYTTVWTPTPDDPRCADRGG
jgi:hypothetical protein